MNKIKETGEYSMSVQNETGDGSPEFEQLIKDAQRYRFLRQFFDPQKTTDDLPNEMPVSVEHGDALLDAAIIKAGFKG